MPYNIQDKKKHKKYPKKFCDPAWMEALTVLKDDFPQCFKKGKKKPPLAIGIHHAVLKHYEHDTRFSRKTWQHALRLYARSNHYLQNVKIGQPRIDLNGNVVGYVTQEEAAYAEKVLNSRLKQTLRKNK